jgi:hypothetical protein
VDVSIFVIDQMWIASILNTRRMFPAAHQLKTSEDIFLKITQNHLEISLEIYNHLVNIFLKITQNHLEKK